MVENAQTEQSSWADSRTARARTPCVTSSTLRYGSGGICSIRTSSQYIPSLLPCHTYTSVRKYVMMEFKKENNNLKETFRKHEKYNKIDLKIFIEN